MYPYLEAGDEIDGLRVLSRIHAGGMALLYRVEGGGTDYPLILKVPRLGQGDGAVAVVSYEVERMMLAALSGPHVPRLAAVGDLERLPYLAMEFIDGPSLKELAEQAPLPPEKLAKPMAAVATAVHHLHQQKLAHLDLKPSNVMFRRNGQAVLIDLGLAHHAHFPDLLAEEFRKPIGSAPYMAPEQVVGVRCDPRSDIFAVGAMLYELATGRLPFGAPDSVRGLRRRLYEAPPPPRVVDPAVPPWLQEIILHCLEVDADRRYATAAQLAFDLLHPDQVVVGARGRLTTHDGWLTRLQRRVVAAGYEPAPCPQMGRRPLVSVVLVGVDTQVRGEQQIEALQQMVRRTAEDEDQVRIALATVIRPHPLLGSSYVEESGGKTHIRHLVELRHWARSIGIPEQRLTYHVLEDDDPAQALLDYARANRVDHILIGASTPGSGIERGLRPFLGSVASRIAQEAPCSVTIVRPEY
ncbi:serine/threonine protein kinase [Denitratisoma sp. DHT3]|uniref:bifunctional serine/threonine-protein kinase/universal stress protein n=1 Tax=Denitratisoma sp. DHT3 TaxID=1981880 RepID=UPI0011982CF8|nr:bifunctional serine/threonine-protein kinase/universal stress protein [Denitratisoma sp. DHT3]QDX82549.1 serine/threonine protein kinase [Denitratisoma sp. DHT3]